MGPLARLRNALYDRGVLASADSPVPVISVGNLCHGGTNKTPMVEMLSRRLTEAGFSVGIVSRGYGSETEAPLWIGQDERSSRREAAGDEPLMLADRLPGAKVVVSPDRREGVRLLAALGADVVVADDAFQHRRMGRDLDIVLIDAACPFGNGRLFPAGILREPLDSLRRAGIVILTKVEQVGAGSLVMTKKALARWVAPENVFTARVTLDSWFVLDRGEWRTFEPEWGRRVPAGRFAAFSAIANPASFERSLSSFGVDVLAHRAYRDHHRFTWRDIDDLERLAKERGADGFVCTEKDMHNLPRDPRLLLPLYVPRIAVSLDDPDGFWRAAARKLRPNLVVASNGYGEDAIGALLADRLRTRFPGASVSAFSLVGSGREYRDRGIPVVSPASDMPSGGVVKYSLRALLRDFRHGLRRDIARQVAAWRANAGRFRTPLCVGDAYLFAQALWGQGMTPVLVATAKSVRLSGHWFIERELLRRRCPRVWTRDGETAAVLREKGVRAVFAGSPIMDLALAEEAGGSPWEGLGRPRVMLLPGSRPRAYGDITLLLGAVDLLNERLLGEGRKCGFVMVLAPTIDRERLLSAAPCVRVQGESVLLERGAWVRLREGSLVPAALGADILIGLGGTANQVAAGLGVPVVSIVERGKLAQKKLLGDAEILVPPAAGALASAAAELLADPLRRDAMARAGIERLGGPGALGSVIEYAAKELGWDARTRLYRRLREIFLPDSPDDSGDRAPDNKGGAALKEVEAEWMRKRKLFVSFAKLTRLAKLAKMPEKR